jgi:hypothetical protein
MEEVTYPEHERLKAVSKESNAIGQFLDWLAGKYTIGKWEELECPCGSGDEVEQLMPARPPIEKLLAEYFEINLDILEKEKQAMLASIRAANG